MLIAPTSGTIGYQPHGSVVRMINKSAATLAIGQVVTSSYTHTSAVFPATTTTESNLTPLACCAIAKGASGVSGFIGVVTDLQSGAGAVGQEVLVQFGGLVKATVTISESAVVTRGNVLGIHNTTGTFDTGTVATSTLPAAIAMETTTATTGTQLMWVMVTPVIWFNAAV